MSSDAEETGPLPPPPRVPHWPAQQPDWVSELVSQFVHAAAQALEARLAPVLQRLELTEVRASERDAEIRALKLQVRRLRRRLDKAGLP